MYEANVADEYYDLDDKEMIIQFSNDIQTYLMFKKCVDKEWTSRHFFREVINPDTEFDDSLVND